MNTAAEALVDSVYIMFHGCQLTIIVFSAVWLQEMVTIMHVQIILGQKAMTPAKAVELLYKRFIMY